MPSYYSLVLSWRGSGRYKYRITGYLDVDEAKRSE